MAFAKAQEMLKLAMMATRRAGVTLEEIEREFGCSHRTAQRMTDALEDVFPQTEPSDDADDRRRRWRIPARPLVPLLTPTADELAAIKAAVSELERVGLTTQSRDLRALDAKVRALIPPEKGTRLAVDEEVLLEALGHAARPGPRPAMSGEIDAAIHEAIRGPFKLRILYRKRLEDKPKRRILAPHGLLLGVRRYLVARDTAKPTTAPLQHYRVEEIYEAEVVDESFDLDVDFDIRRHAERAFGSFVSDAQYGEVVWRFNPEAAPHARRFVFHPNQSVQDEADGSLLVRFRASGHLEMCWHLYSWGDSVEVLQPAALRAMVQGHQRRFDALP